MGEILFTAVVVTYNHKNYIRDCIEGILKQETNFEFEIIVHDDASTDGTSDILREYGEKYKDKIRLVIQEENIYSRGLNIVPFVKDYIHGKYMATIDGDDYWTDSKKLQKQVDFLENNPEYVACAHVADYTNEETGAHEFLPPIDHDRDISTEEVLEWDVKYRFQTATNIYRTEGGWKDVPDRYMPNGGNDYSTAVWLAVNGKMRVLKDCMSVYRVCTPGSYTATLNKTAQEKINKINDGWIQLLRVVDEDTDGKYHKKIDHLINRRYAKRSIRNKKYKKALFKYSKVWKIEEDSKFKRKLIIRALFPMTHKLICKIRGVEDNFSDYFFRW